MADALDSKSGGSDTMWVRLPPSAPFGFDEDCCNMILCSGLFFIYGGGVVACV